MELSIVDRKLNEAGIYSSRYRRVIKQVLSSLPISDLDIQLCEPNCYPVFINALCYGPRIEIEMWPNSNSSGDYMVVIIGTHEYRIPF